MRQNKAHTIISSVLALHDCHSIAANYHTLKDHELTERLEQVWSTLSTDKKQAIVLLLDSFSQTKFDN